VHDTHAAFLFVVMLVCKMLLWRIEGHLLFRVEGDHTRGLPLEGTRRNSYSSPIKFVR